MATPQAHVSASGTKRAPLYMFSRRLPARSTQIAAHNPYLYVVRLTGRGKAEPHAATWNEAVRQFDAHADAWQVDVYTLDGEAVVLAAVVQVR